MPEAGVIGISDPELLALAAREGRVLVSHDVHTMPYYFTEFVNNGGQSAGLILVKQFASFTAVIDDLLLIWEAGDPMEWLNKIDFLPWS